MNHTQQQKQPQLVIIYFKNRFLYIQHVCSLKIVNLISMFSLINYCRIMSEQCSNGSTSDGS